MTFSAELFLRSAREAEKIFTESGFKTARTEHDAPFGSHYSEYRNGEEYFRFLWDGKEQWLQLVNGHDGHAEQELFFRWMRGGTHADYEMAAHDAVKVIRNYFTSHAHETDENCCSCSHHHT